MEKGWNLVIKERKGTIKKGARIKDDRLEKAAKRKKIKANIKK
jgi:hypothetical protein